MRLWFKYNRGFINIDDEFVYLTNTGNWSEVVGMHEKGVSKSSNRRKYRMIFFLVVCALLFSYLIFRNMSSGNMNFLLLLGLPALLFLAYRTLSPEMGSKFKIPHAKLKRIDIEDGVVLHFLDGLDQPKSEQIRGLEEKGIQALQALINNGEPGK